MTTKRRPQTNEQLFRRLEKKLEVNDNLCWNWTGIKDKDGYGFIKYRKTHTLITTKRTHRITYEHYFGPIPKNLQIDHLCRNRACCNPRHLETVTCKENIRRGNTGHTRTPEQMRQLAITYWSKQPKRGKARREAGKRLSKYNYYKLLRQQITSGSRSEAYHLGNSDHQNRDHQNRGRLQNLADHA